MKKIYLIAGSAIISLVSFAQPNAAGKGTILSSKSLNRNVSAERLTNPDTTGLVNYTDFQPEFAPSGMIYNFGYTGGGYVYGNNVDGLNICAQGYQNIIGSPMKVIGAIAWFVEKQSDLTSSGTSKVVVKAYNIQPNRAANTNGSGTFNSTLNWPGPAATAAASADILFTDIDTVNFNYVAFATPPTFMGDFAIACDFSTLAAGDTAGLICDKPFTPGSPGDAMNLDYTYHFYSGKWYVTDQMFSPAAGPDFGSGQCDNDCALFAVVSDATGVNEFVNGMKLTTYPNPATDNVTFEYTLEKDASSVKLVVIDAAGHKIMNNDYNAQKAGSYKVNLDATGLAAGTYFYQLFVGGHYLTKQVTITK
jgi:hypothetical protein